MMAVQGVSGLAVAAAGGGLLFLWSGIKGGSVTKNLRALISGQQPSGTNANPITGTPGQAAGQAPGQEVPGVTSGPPSPNQTYTHAQLAQLWQQAGGSAASANNAACHAIQESGGRSWVTSPNPDGGTNVGLWQLDTRGKGAGYTVAQLQNPMNNARITVFATANGSDWSAWATPGC